MEFSQPNIFYYFFLLLIPIIIHLFNLRRHKKIYFSNIYFLQKIQTKSKAKQKIKRWILLLNRLSIISSLILAFSLPFIINNPNEKQTKKIGIYLDNSFSMSLLDTDNTQLITLAKKNAKEIIKQLNENEKILILTNDFEKKHQKWYGKENALSLIDSIKISGNKQDFHTVINRFNKNIDSLELNKLYLLSDFQKTDNRSLPNLNKYNSTKILHLKSNNPLLNISIDSCYFPNPFRKENEIENLNVIITNHGNENITTSLKLFINGKRSSMNNIEVPKNTSITRTLYYVNTSKNNIINGIITIDDSGIQYDNKLYFAYSIKEKIPVLSIYEDSLSNYIYNIFSDSLFDFQKQNINHIEYNNIKNYNLIVLDQLTKIPQTLKEVLKTHLNGGQNIFVFLKQKINQKSYNVFFKSVNGDIINEWDNTKKQVEYINYVHPIFKSVFQQQKQNINLPKTNGCFSIIENEKSHKRDILNFIDQTPFLAEYFHQKGRLFICFGDLTTHSNFGQHALFVPTLYNASILNDNKNKIYHTINNEVIIRQNQLNVDDVIHLKKEDIFNLRVQSIHHPQKTLINFGNKIQTDGHYELIVNEVNTSPLAFNYNRNESQMYFLNKDEIKRKFQDKNIELLKVKKNTLTKKYTEKKDSNLEYFFIRLTIILLIIELILLRLWKI